MALVDWPLADQNSLIVPKKYWERISREAMQQATEEGRGARRAGQPVTSCPLFKDRDLEISWKMGWRWEDEDIRNRK